MDRRRSKLEIYLDVLWAIKEGTDKPTRIMYSANLSWKPLQKILDLMVSQGLIAEIESDIENSKDKRTTKTYSLTQKGENTIRYFTKADEYLLIDKTSKTR